ncbi:AraC family transcriptional regulator [Kosakonia sp.]|uniref:AraC family transcriptional regulator n=1 Tax=Kosakonia sp. TaxID=1916651 RepID=UPI00289E885A|nr:AraC family transcriptional regulator [Kosakonia sp.]
MSITRDIQQSFYRPETLPGVELRSTWRNDQAYKRHSHAELSIGAVVEGQTHCVCNGQEYLLSPGDIIVIPPLTPHSCNPLAGQARSYHMLWIPQVNGTQQLIRNPHLFQQYLHIVSLFDSGQARALPVAINRLLAGLSCAPSPSPLRPISQQMQSVLLENLQQPPTLDALAHAFSLRKETLIRTFKQDTGLTPGSFLNSARVEFAKSRLRAGDNLADVGYQSGFADQSHFHRTFVSYTAATPRQYATGRSISDNK